MLLVLYLLLCLIVGIAGRNRPIGFIWYFLLSILLSPVVMLFVLLLTRERRPKYREAECCSGRRYRA